MSRTSLILSFTAALSVAAGDAWAGWCVLDARFEPRDYPGQPSFYAVSKPVRVRDSMHCHEQKTKFPRSIKDHWNVGSNKPLGGDVVANAHYSDKKSDANTWFRQMMGLNSTSGSTIDIDDYQVDYEGM